MAGYSLGETKFVPCSIYILYSKERNCVQYSTRYSGYQTDLQFGSSSRSGDLFLSGQQLKGAKLNLLVMEFNPYVQHACRDTCYNLDRWMEWLPVFRRSHSSLHAPFVWTDYVEFRFWLWAHTSYVSYVVLGKKIPPRGQWPNFYSNVQSTFSN